MGEPGGLVQFRLSGAGLVDAPSRGPRSAGRCDGALSAVARRECRHISVDEVPSMTSPLPSPFPTAGRLTRKTSPLKKMLRTLNSTCPVIDRKHAGTGKRVSGCVNLGVLS